MLLTNYTGKRTSYVIIDMVIALLELHKQLLDLVSNVLDLSGKLRGFVGKDTATDHWAGDATGTAKSDLGWDEHVGNVLCK